VPKCRRSQCHIARQKTWRISAKDSCLPRITRLLIPQSRKGPETPKTGNMPWKSHTQRECVLGLKHLDIRSELDLLAKNFKMLHLNTQYCVNVTGFGWSVVCMLCVRKRGERYRAELSYLTSPVTAVITAWFNEMPHSLCYEIKNAKSVFSQVWVIWRLGPGAQSYLPLTTFPACPFYLYCLCCACVVQVSVLSVGWSVICC